MVNTNNFTTASAQGSNNSIVFAADAGSFVLRGNTMNLDAAGVLTNLSTNVQTLDMGLNFQVGTANIGATSNSIILNGVIGGTNITKSGNGTLFLNGANNFTGALTNNAGVTRVANNSGLGATNGRTEIRDGAALELTTNSLGGSLSIGNEALRLWGSGISGDGALRSLAGNNTLGGTITVLTNDTAIGVDVGSLSISNIAIANLGLNKVGAGTLIINGTNNLALLMQVSAGTMQLGANAVFARTNAYEVDNGAVLDLNGRTVNMSDIDLNGGTITTGAGSVLLKTNTAYLSNTITSFSNNATSSLISGNLDLGGRTVFVTVEDGGVANDLVISANISNGNLNKVLNNGEGVLVLSGTNTYGSTTIENGTLQVGDGGTTGTLGTGAVTNNAALTVNRSGAITISNNISGTGTFTNYGPGTLTLSGSNTYAGVTTLDGGATIVTGSISNNATLYVGRSTSNVSLSITNGGTVANTDGYIGYNAGASGNNALVTGANSLWTNGSYLFVGNDGSSNRLVISEGGKVASYNSAIGGGANSSNNSVLVSGTSSLWANGNDLLVGNSGSGNSLTISNGGRVAVANNSYIGYDALSSNNSVLVTGEDSLWTNSKDIYVGKSGSGNNLVISNGGKVALTGEIYAGHLVTSSNNSITVTGSNSVLSQVGGDPYENIYVGADGSGNRLTVSGGATVTNDGGFYIGVGRRGGPYSDNNTVLVEGAGSKIISVGQFNEMADWGSGNQLIISNGGSVTFGGDGFWMSWDPLSVSNSIVVTGSNSTFTTAGNTYLGKSGSGNTVLVADGAVFNSGSSWISDKQGADIASNNSVLVTGAGSVWSNSGTLTIGSAGSGTLTIANGGKVVAANTKIGDLAGSAGTINVGTLGGNDTNVTLTTPSIQFGLGTGALNLNQSDRMTLSAILAGSGALNQRGSGTTEVTGLSAAYTGLTTVSAGTLLVNGSIESSAVTVQNGATLGGDGTVGVLTILDGGTLSPGNSPGNLTVAGNVIWNGGGNYNWQVYDTTSTAGTGWDLVSSTTGTLDYSALNLSSKFNINLWSLDTVSPDSDGNALNFNNTQSYTWTILTGASAINPFAGAWSDYFNINVGPANGAAGFANSLGGGAFSLVIAGNDLNLVFTPGTAAVPEPGTWAAAALLAGGAALARWRRRAK